MKIASLFVGLCLATTVCTAKPVNRSTALQMIGFGSCALQGAPQPVWKGISKAKPQVFVMLGDNIYADTADMSVMTAKYAQLGSEPGFQELRRKAHILPTWDDHDFGFNDSGAEYPKKRESQAQFMDFFQFPANSPLRSQEGVYHAEIFGPPGKRVQFILLDTRYFRSPLISKPSPVDPKKRVYVPNTDPQATILGAAQWLWLEQQLQQPAELRLICSSIQVVAEDHGSEKWMNFPLERQKLFGLIAKTHAQGVVFLSGDRHFAELSVMDGGVGYPLYDVTSSGLNRGFQGGWRLPNETNRHRVGMMNIGHNFGTVQIQWDGPSTELRLEIRDVPGDVRICQKVPLSWLTPKK